MPTVVQTVSLPIFCCWWKSSESPFRVDHTYYQTNLTEGYIAVAWHCALGNCGFIMHLSIADWDMQLWAQNAVTNLDGTFDPQLASDNLDDWKRECVPLLDSVECLNPELIVGVPSKHNRWRIIMKSRCCHTWRKLKGIQSVLSNALGITLYNQVHDLHVSLDRWWGAHPGTSTHS